MNRWMERLRSRMQQLELTQDQLAAKLGITRSAVQHYLSGLRVPPLRQFQKLASILKVDPAWLQFGTHYELAPKNLTGKNPKPVPIRRPIPILTWKQASERLDVSRMKPEDFEESISHLFSDQQDWYALRVQGDAMTALSANKNFQEEDLIIIDPNKTPKNGDFIITSSRKTNPPLLRQYVIDGGVKYLKPLNQQYPLIEASKGTLIFGVVVMNIKMIN